MNTEAALPEAEINPYDLLVQPEALRMTWRMARAHGHIWAEAFTGEELASLDKPVTVRDFGTKILNYTHPYNQYECLAFDTFPDFSPDRGYKGGALLSGMSPACSWKVESFPSIGASVIVTRYGISGKLLGTFIPEPASSGTLSVDYTGSSSSMSLVQEVGENKAFLLMQKLAITLDAAMGATPNSYYKISEKYPQLDTSPTMRAGRHLFEPGAQSEKGK